MFADTGIKLSPKMSGVRDIRLLRNGRCPGGASNAENKDGCLEAAGEPIASAGGAATGGAEAGLAGFPVAFGGAGTVAGRVGCAAGDFEAG